MTAAEEQLQRRRCVSNTVEWINSLSERVVEPLRRHMADVVGTQRAASLADAARLFVSADGRIDSEQISVLQSVFTTTRNEARRIHKAGEALMHAAELQGRAANLAQLHTHLSSTLDTPANDDTLLQHVQAVLTILAGDPAATELNQVSMAMDKLLEVTKVLDSDIWAVVAELARGQAALTLLREFGADVDLRNLAMAAEEYVGDYFAASEEAVQALLDLHAFLRPLLDTQMGDLMAFLQQVGTQFESHRRRRDRDAETTRAAQSLPMMIELCSTNADKLRRLWQSLTNRGEVARHTILRAMDCGQVRLRCSSYMGKASVAVEFTANTADIASHGGQRTLSWVELNDLQGRAQLHVGDDSHGQRMSEFVRSIEVLQGTHSMLQSMACSGDLGVFRDFDNGGSLPFNVEAIETMNMNLGYECQESENVRIGCRQTHPPLRLFFGQQVSQLFSCLLRPPRPGKEKQKRLAVADCRHLLAVAARATVLPGGSAVQPYPTVAFVNVPYPQSRHERESDNKLDWLGQRLTKLLPGAGLPPRVGGTAAWPTELQEPGAGMEAPASALKTAMGRNNTLIVVRCESSNAQLAAMAAATLLAGRQPYNADSVMLAHAAMQWSELESLLLRCVASGPQGTALLAPAVLCGHDRLRVEVQQKLADKLRTWDQDVQVLRRPLVLIVPMDAGHDLITEQLLGADRVTWPNPAHEELRCAMQAACRGLGAVSFISSEQPGQGKTRWVESQAAAQQRELVPVRLHGHVDLPRIRQQLAAAFPVAQRQSPALHFDLGAVTVAELPLLRAVLTELLLLRRISLGEAPVALPLDAPIFVEVGNTLGASLLHGLSLLPAFAHTELAWDLESFEVPEHPGSDVHIVCTHLAALDDGSLAEAQLDDTMLLAAPDCRALLATHYPPAAQPQCSFAELNIFISVLAEQLKRFRESFFFLPMTLEDMGAPRAVRVQLCEALVATARSFAAPSVERVRELQAVHLGHISGQEQAETLLNRFAHQERWLDRDHLMVLMHKDGSCMTPLYRSPDVITPGVRQLLNSQNQCRSTQGAGATPGLESLQPWQMRQMLHCLAHEDSISDSEAQIAVSSMDSNVVRGPYSLTVDTLLKSAIILQRMQARVPVILMGEAGVGKTSLLAYLAHVARKELVVCAVHAGTPLKALEDQVATTVEHARTHPTEDIILFFDEVNTSAHVGYIIDLIIHRIGLPDNVVPVAACNPYRKRERPQLLAGLAHDTVDDDLQAHLRYRVLPLPEAALTYVWDYGSLDPGDESLYVESMLQSIAQPASGANGCGLAAGSSGGGAGSDNGSARAKDSLGIGFPEEDVHGLAQLVCALHDFYRQREADVDVAISLRDVARFQRLAAFFGAYRGVRKMVQKEERKLGWRPLERDYHHPGYILSKEWQSVLMALMFTYVLRLPSTNLREEVMSVIVANQPRRRGGGGRFTKANLDSLLHYEQRELFARMTTKSRPFLAQNQALLENIFCLTVSILAREPCFLVGKPGCSKTLSVAIINDSLRGPDSEDRLLRQFPGITLFPYQGSEESTSAGIEEVFAKAFRYLDRAERGAAAGLAVIPVVLLDEISLAERSPSRPLKVS